MSRKLKPYKVDTIHTRKGTVDMFLDREDKIFFGMIGPTRVQAITAEECRKKLYKAMSDWDGLVWKQYIHLQAESHLDGHYSHSGFDADNVSLNMHFYRFEGAQTLDGKWVCRRFKEDTRGGEKWYDPEKMDPWYRDLEEEEDLIPYSEEAWAALQKIKGALAIAGDQLKTLACAKNLPQLIAGGVKLLQAPEKPSKKKKKRRK